MELCGRGVAEAVLLWLCCWGYVVWKIVPCWCGRERSCTLLGMWQGIWLWQKGACDVVKVRLYLTVGVSGEILYLAVAVTGEVLCLNEH